jgi:hypothetical protein
MFTLKPEITSQSTEFAGFYASMGKYQREVSTIGKAFRPKTVIQDTCQTGKPMFGGAISAMDVSGDPKSLVLAVMKELTKNNKFMHKADVYAHLQYHISKKDFDHALNVLCDNGDIYSPYTNDIYSITD